MEVQLKSVKDIKRVPDGALIKFSENDRERYLDKFSMCIVDDGGGILITEQLLTDNIVIAVF